METGKAFPLIIRAERIKADLVQQIPYLEILLCFVSKKSGKYAGFFLFMNYHFSLQNLRSLIYLSVND